MCMEAIEGAFSLGIAILQKGFCKMDWNWLILKEKKISSCSRKAAVEGEDDFKGSVHCIWFHGWTLKALRSVCALLSEPGQASPVLLAPGTPLSSSDSLSVCPLRLEKPNGESSFFLTAITSLAESERLGKIVGRRVWLWEKRLQVRV